MTKNAGEARAVSVPFSEAYRDLPVLPARNESQQQSQDLFSTQVGLLEQRLDEPESAKRTMCGSSLILHVGRFRELSSPSALRYILGHCPASANLLQGSSIFVSLWWESLAAVPSAIWLAFEAG